MSYKTEDQEKLAYEIKLGNIQKLANDDNVMYKCKICTCLICGMTQAIDHAVGTKHYKMSRNVLAKLTHPRSDSSVPQLSRSEEGHNSKYLKMESTLDILNIRKPNVNISKLNNEHEKESIVAAQDSFFCTVCKLSVTGTVPLEQHLAGKVHKRKLQIDLAMAQMGATLSLNPNPSGTRQRIEENIKYGVPQDEVVFECEVCDAFFTGEIPKLQHLNGKAHLKKLRATGAMTPAAARPAAAWPARAPAAPTASLYSLPPTPAYSNDSGSDSDSENLIYVIQNGIKNRSDGSASFHAPIRIIETNEPIPKLF